MNQKLKMKKFKTGHLSCLCVVFCCYAFMLFSGCAQIGAPTGGPRDTLAPVLLKARPENMNLNFIGNRIVFQFNEYIEVRDLQNNLLISPYQKASPLINYNFRTVTVKFRDTLLPNTTYTLDFGSAIRDLNEGNPINNFTYTFSTGDRIDSLSLSGTVTLAETGKVDSTMLVMLYRDLSDTAVQKKRPLYVARVRGDGSFRFENLPAATFNIYALKDGDNSKTYNSKSEMFAFLDSSVTLSKPVEGIRLFAYEEEKRSTGGIALKPAPEKRLRYSTSITGGKQDILNALDVVFNTGIKDFPQDAVLLTDTNHNPLPGVKYTLDSTRRNLTINYKWQPANDYKLIVSKNVVDSGNNSLPKSDTIAFKTKAPSDYGRVVLRFSNLPLERNPVIQFVQGEKIIMSFPLTASEWKNTLFPPGEYDIRILYDANKNGAWDPGNYETKKQPERSITLPQKLSIRADWDNERDIKL